jgi:hypothetical protein
LSEGRTRAVTAESYAKRVRLLSKIADIEDPERIKGLICSYPASEARKELLSNAYDYYCEFKGYKWVRPKFKRVDVSIFLPHESELDALIANTRDHSERVHLEDKTR